MRGLIISGLALASLVGLPTRAFAQGGERPPRWEIPGLDISRNGGWRTKARRVAVERAGLLSRGETGRLNAALVAGPSMMAPAVSGIFSVPMVLFHYNGTPSGDIRDPSEYSDLLFGTTPPPGRPYTLRTFYDQMSDGLFTMTGQAIGWAELDSVENTYAGHPATSGCFGNPAGGSMCNGLFSADATRRMQTGLREALTKVDEDVDFGLFDNDGPDNEPNSGDDDGVVDMIGFAHATQDGACASSTNNHLWAHRWVLGGGDGAGDFVTDDASDEGGFIRIRDYFIQSALGGGQTGSTTGGDACDAGHIMAIGTAAHEFGHALGLPDLYDTQGATEGLGRWGLMGTGNYSSGHSPARMEAWSLNELGWVEVAVIDTDLAPRGVPTTFTVGPVQTSDSVFLIRVDGSNPNGEYIVLENRQAQQGDTALIRNACQVWYQADVTTCLGGLLIWHIDSAKVRNGMFSNQVNFGPVHGVKLEEADNDLDLWCANGSGANKCNRGDAGDVYPGMAVRTAFTFGTEPAAKKNADGGYIGFDIDLITLLAAGEMSFRITFDNTPALVVESSNPRPPGVMGANYRDSLEASGGNGAYVWAFHSGTLPSGVSIAASGLVSGVPGATGNFGYTARVTSGAKVETRSYTLVVSAPALTQARVLPRLFNPSATTLTAEEISYLDLLGNKNGQLDVGDFKAWVDASGGPP